LLTLFFRYFRPLIDAGYIYIAQPPLFRVQKGKEAKYAFSEKERDQIIAEFQKLKTEKVKEEKGEAEETVLGEETPEGETKIKGMLVQRYKGLGEMNPDQLWDTTMDPERRVMKQVKIEDAEEADKVFDILMGDEVAPRKHFIQTHAKSVKNLDV